jgi:hypothetical protein
LYAAWKATADLAAGCGAAKLAPAPARVPAAIPTMAVALTNVLSMRFVRMCSSLSRWMATPPRRYAGSTTTPATEHPAIGTAAAIFEKPFTTRQRTPRGMAVPRDIPMAQSVTPIQNRPAFPDLRGPGKAPDDTPAAPIRRPVGCRKAQTFSRATDVKSATS